MQMELTLAIAALVLISVVYAVASIKAKRALAQANEDRARLYRDCFLRGLAGILARMASADGKVTLDEVKVVGRLFNDMGLADVDRQLCFDAFRAARDASLPMNYYVTLFAPYATKESRTLLYEVLWDVASADGKFDPKEEEFLKKLTTWLRLDESCYQANLSRCTGFGAEPDVRMKEASRKLDRLLN